MLEFLGKRQYLLYLLICSLFIIFLAYITRVFFLLHFSPQNLFILELVGIDFKFPILSYYLFSLGTFLVFCAISFKLFSYPNYFLPPLIFTLSGWFYYLTVAQSFYIYLLFFVLAAGYGMVLILKKNIQLGKIIFLIASIIITLSSLPAALLPLLSVVSLYILKLVDRKILKTLIMVILLSFLPLLLLIFIQKEAFGNIYQNQITIYANPGILAESNRLQGDTKKTGYTFLARMTENKYLYTAKFTFLKILKQITPSSYFTQQERLLNFSFTPPIFLGFLIPFIYGAYTILNNPNLKKYLLLLPILVIPSLLSQKMVDLNRLILVAPAIILVIAYGLNSLEQRAKKMQYKIILMISLILVLVQLIFTTGDVILREDLRYHRYFGVNLFDDLGKQ